MIDFYKEFGNLGYLANYSHHGFYKDGVFYKTAEHYYQASKFNDLEIKNKIINSSTPKEASMIGRDVNNKRIDNFKNYKLDVMFEAVYLKFSQNKDIRTKLIETRNQTIREMTVKESFWGVGPNLDGLNHMGKILEKVRYQVKNDLIDQIIANSYKKKVYIIGHKKPDFDSFFSAYLLSKILKSFNVDAIFAVRDEDFIDKKMINDWLDFKYEVVTDYSDKYFILVDHNNLDGIDKTHVLGAIDHHKITGEVSDLIEIEYASCALLIYDLFKSRYAFSFKEKKLIALSVLSDTEFLSSSRFSSEDKKLYDELDANIDVSQFKRKYLITTDFSMDINSNLFYDFKEYRVGRRIIKRSLIRSYSADKDKYYNLYVSAMKQYNVNLIIWCDYEKLVTYVRYNDIDIIYPYFTTSTNLIINYLVNEKYLKK